MKNKISVRLSLYFGITLLLFTLIISIVFFWSFRSQTIRIHKQELQSRAVSIADTLSETAEASGNKGFGYGIGANGGYGALLRFLPELAGADVWVVDENLELLTAGRGGISNTYHYSDLPSDAESIINEVFTDKIVFSETFSGVLKEQTLTVGVPVKQNDQIVGVVLLHSPVNGINETVQNVSYILMLSLLLGLILSLILSIILSKHFTDPIVFKQAQDILKNEKLRRDFVSNVSHELKTPVTVIRCSLEAIHENVINDPEHIKEYNLTMLNEARHLERLVGDLLDLSRLQNPDFSIDKNEISLCDVIDDVTRSVSKIATAKNIAIKVNKDGSPCLFYGDYGRLRQMLMIILDNAIKFSQDGGIVELSLKNNALSVKDYGNGIPKEDLPHIFDRFYKSRDESNKQGTGLGLPIAKEIADRHNIIIIVNSDQNGTEFIFEFPLKHIKENTKKI